MNSLTNKESTTCEYLEKITSISMIELLKYPKKTNESIKQKTICLFLIPKESRKF